MTLEVATLYDLLMTDQLSDGVPGGGVGRSPTAALPGAIVRFINPPPMSQGHAMSNKCPTKLSLKDIMLQLEKVIAYQTPMQITDHAHPDHGALCNPFCGIADPRLTGIFIANVAYLFLGTGKTDETLWEQAMWAADYLLRAQHPSGLIDLISVNYDSSPDTAFSVQDLCPIIEWGRERAATSRRWAELVDKLEIFARRAVPGLLSGGFHTPNHRWAITSALVQAKALFPELDVADTVEAYLAEGYDVNKEGAFTERSIGVYDAVVDRSLQFIAEYWDRPHALEVVEKNLDFNLYMLHADGTAETGLSRRQDYGTRVVPSGLASCYLVNHYHRPNPVFLQAAQTLYAGHTALTIDLRWLCYALLKCGNPQPTVATLPEDFDRHFPLSGIWRVRRGLLSASFFEDVTRLMTLTFGQAELSGLKISQTYFGGNCGHFIGDSLTVAGNRAVLRSNGLRHPRRPGYELPLGRPVPPDKWDEMIAQRDLRHLPPIVGELTVTEVAGGFDLRYQTLDGLDGVAAQIAFDFPPGGVWETADTAIQPGAGQVIFLKRGHGTMRYGNDVIQIEPGAHAHKMWQMRSTEAAPDHVRVLLTFKLPVDHIVRLRVYQGVSPKAQAHPPSEEKG